MPPDVVGRAPETAAAMLRDAGWAYRCRATGWRGWTPSGTPATRRVSRVIAVRPAGPREVELVLANFPVDPGGPGAPAGEGG